VIFIAFSCIGPIRLLSKLQLNTTHGNIT